MGLDIDRLLLDVAAITSITGKLKSVYRALAIEHDDRLETTAEHSFQLAMVVWTAAKHFPELDAMKCVRYALVHDLVEAFAGDLDALTCSDEERTRQKENEKEALEQLKNELYAHPEVIQAILEYEELLTEEADFVYGWDKLVPWFVELANGMSSSRGKGLDCEQLYKKVYLTLGNLNDPGIFNFQEILRELKYKASQYL